MPLDELLTHGSLLFSAAWTAQEGGDRPLSKGTGGPLSDRTSPLQFPRNFNRVSAPDANSCAGCHNAPFGIAGGGGDFVTGFFVLGQRFDFATVDHMDPVITKGCAASPGATLYGFSRAAVIRRRESSTFPHMTLVTGTRRSTSTRRLFTGEFPATSRHCVPQEGLASMPSFRADLGAE